MSFAADIRASRLCVLLDVRHPLAYLALHPALAFARSGPYDVDWLPLTVPALKPPSPEQPDDDRGAWHRRHRARAIRREIDTYAAVQGLTLRDPYRSEPADAAHLAWLWVRHERPARLTDFLVELFGRFWSRALDASDPAAVAPLVADVGGDAAAFRAWAEGEGPQRAQALADELAERGLFQVPAYVVEDEVFYGRQHLPMIRWILEGRTGPVPI